MEQYATGRAAELFKVTRRVCGRFPEPASPYTPPQGKQMSLTPERVDEIHHEIHDIANRNIGAAEVFPIAFWEASLMDFARAIKKELQEADASLELIKTHVERFAPLLCMERHAQISTGWRRGYCGECGTRARGFVGCGVRVDAISSPIKE